MLKVVKPRREHDKQDKPTSQRVPYATTIVIKKPEKTKIIFRNFMPISTIR